MAKRAGAGKNGIVVAQEIRALIEANKGVTGPEVMAALREKFPKVSFNDKSCQVSYANIRKSLGLSRTMKKKPGAPEKKAGRHIGNWRQVTPPTADSAIDLSLLQAAKALLQHCNGDAAVAAQALKQVASLQMN